MPRHVFEPKQFHNVLGSLQPVYSIADGDTVVTTTVDAWGFDGSGQRRAEPPNPMTGPFFIQGAAAGDTLAVTIDRLTPNRDEGWTHGPVAPNVVTPTAAAELPKRIRVLWNIERNRGIATLKDAPPALKALELPLEPMLGCFGVAPELGQAFSTATSSSNGGNMDYRRF
ncbi:MAG: acetamidase/formamidase family protein, partial [Ancalomicrobiaceae bacterium]|nr:acetamidase/formamidase family protein [Ancalomicrobiaceae bacterium]